VGTGNSAQAPYLSTAWSSASEYDSVFGTLSQVQPPPVPLRTGSTARAVLSTTMSHLGLPSEYQGITNVEYRAVIRQSESWHDMQRRSANALGRLGLAPVGRDAER
jgi:hypothetical protein